MPKVNIISLLVALLAIEHSQTLKSPLDEYYIQSTQPDKMTPPSFEVQIQNPIVTDSAAVYQSVNMMLNLHNSETFVNLQCAKLAKVDEKAITGAMKSDPNHKIKYAMAEVTGYLATAHIHLGEDQWQLSNQLTVGLNCEQTLGMDGAPVLGFIGLGTKDTSSNWKKKNTKFAVNFEPINNVKKDFDPWAKNFYFTPEVKEEIRGRPVYSLNTGLNWESLAQTIQVGGDELKLGDTIRVIFDLNYKNIGFPDDLYTQIKSKLDTAGLKWNDFDRTLENENCADESSQCFKNLPNITIITTSGENKVVIEPKHYVQTFKTSNSRYCYIVDTSTPMKTWTPVSSYRNGYIILGQEFMRHFYTVFDMKENYVNIYNNEDPAELAKKKKRAPVVEDPAEKEKREKVERERKEQEDKERKEKEDKERKEKEDKEKKEKEGGDKGHGVLFWIIIIVVIVLVIAAIGGAVYWMKFRKTEPIGTQYDEYDSYNKLVTEKP